MKSIITIVCCVLQDGLGDLGNLLSFIEVLKAAGVKADCHALILYLPQQEPQVKKLTSDAEGVVFHFLPCPVEVEAYKQEDLSAYNVPAPGLPRVPDACVAVFEASNHIIEFPVAYPFIADLLGVHKDKALRFLEYGRSFPNMEAGIVPMGIRAHEKGIIVQGAKRFEGKLSQLPWMHKALLLEGDSDDTYLARHQLRVAYFKQNPNDKQLNHFKHYLMLQLLLSKESPQSLDLFCPSGIADMSGLYPFFESVGIGRVQILTPEKVGEEHCLSQALPARLRLFSGFKLSQKEFLSLLGNCMKSLSSGGIYMMGACGDGSLTDMLSLAYHSDQGVLIPSIQPVTSYQYETLEAVKAAIVVYLPEGYKGVLDPFFNWADATPQDILSQAKIVSLPIIQQAFKQGIRDIVETKNIIDTLKSLGVVVQ